jgi:hypothetical protein
LIDAAVHLQSPSLGEGPEAAVVGFFHIIRKTAAGQLLHTQMVSQAITAYPLFVTAGVCAIAILQVLRLITFHNIAASFFKSSKLHLGRYKQHNRGL